MANLNMGATLQHKGQHLEALKYLAAAQAMGNRSPALTYHIGESQLALGQIDHALTNLSNALRIQLDAGPDQPPPGTNDPATACRGCSGSTAIQDRHR